MGLRRPKWLQQTGSLRAVLCGLNGAFDIALKQQFVRGKLIVRSYSVNAANYIVSDINAIIARWLDSNCLGGVDAVATEMRLCTAKRDKEGTVPRAYATPPITLDN